MKTLAWISIAYRQREGPELRVGSSRAGAARLLPFTIVTRTPTNVSSPNPAVATMVGVTATFYRQFSSLKSVAEGWLELLIVYCAINSKDVNSRHWIRFHLRDTRYRTRLSTLIIHKYPEIIYQGYQNKQKPNACLALKPQQLSVITKGFVLSNAKSYGHGDSDFQDFWHSCYSYVSAGKKCSARGFSFILL